MMTAFGTLISLALALAAPFGALSNLTVTYVPDGLQGMASTTRFWDCNKPACAWPGKENVTAPAASCARDGWTRVAPSERGGIVNGTAFVCTDQQPRVTYSDPENTSMAFVAFQSGERARSCCACLELRFLDARLEGKRVLAQVVNANRNWPNGELMEFAIPGGGFGALDACTPQWGEAYDWGRYGAVKHRPLCSRLPGPLQRGCLWRFDWLLNVFSDVEYREIECPYQLTKRSGCSQGSVDPELI